MLNKRSTWAIVMCYASLALMGAALIGFLAASKSTHAWLSDEEVSAGNSFTTATWEVDPGWTFSPGNSKATWPYPGQPPYIAQYENEKLVLDFGDIRAGNNNNSPDVFWIANTSSSPITVTFSLNAEMASYFSRIGFKDDNVLEPGEEKSVEMKLDTTSSTPVGMYEGVLTVSCGVGYTEMTIPVRFEVLSP